jgi:spermidine synthase
VNSINSYQNWLNEHRRVVFWEREGVESSVAVKRTNGYAFVINGKVDGNARGDAPTQVMSAILSGALPDSPKKGLVIGLGTGSTAGWLAKVPSIEQVDVVELEPAILDVAKLCAPVNEDCLNNPKVNTIIGDAREVLTTTSESYDVVFSEPSNPYRAGIASLFTQEFYRAVASRLNERGLFLQWVQAYHVDAQTIRTVFATMNSVFGAVEVWESLVGADLILVASKEPIVHNVARLKELSESDPFDRALATVWGVDGVEGLFTAFIGGPELVRKISAGETEVCTDDNSLVEYGFARGQGRSRQFETHTLRVVAQQIGADRPMLDGEVDWVLVTEKRSARKVMEGRPWRNDAPNSALDKAARLRIDARKHYAAGRLVQSLDTWARQKGGAQAIADDMMLGEVLAMKGSPDAQKHIEALRKYQPTMALALEAQSAAAAKDWERAVAKLEAAFTAYRTDPWPFRPLMARALYLAYQLGTQQPAVVPRLDAAMSKPFSVGCLDDYRMKLRVKMAFESKAKGLCIQALAPMEPHIPWNKEFLEKRYACYKAGNDALLTGRAAEDLLRYLANSPPPLITNL